MTFPKHFKPTPELSHLVLLIVVCRCSSMASGVRFRDKAENIGRPASDFSACCSSCTFRLQGLGPQQTSKYHPQVLIHMHTYGIMTATATSPAVGTAIRIS